MTATTAQQNWYVLQGTIRRGPFLAEDLKKSISDGVFTGLELAWTDGMPAWQPLATIPQFSAVKKTSGGTRTDLIRPTPTAHAPMPQSRSSRLRPIMFWSLIAIAIVIPSLGVIVSYTLYRSLSDTTRRALHSEWYQAHPMMRDWIGPPTQPIQRKTSPAPAPSAAPETAASAQPTPPSTEPAELRAVLNMLDQCFTATREAKTSATIQDAFYPRHDRARKLVKIFLARPTFAHQDTPAGVRALADMSERLRTIIDRSTRSPINYTQFLEEIAPLEKSYREASDKLRTAAIPRY